MRLRWAIALLWLLLRSFVPPVYMSCIIMPSSLMLSSFYVGIFSHIFDLIISWSQHKFYSSEPFRMDLPCNKSDLLPQHGHPNGCTVIWTRATVLSLFAHTITTNTLHQYNHCDIYTVPVTWRVGCPPVILSPDSCSCSCCCRCCELDCSKVDCCSCTGCSSSQPPFSVLVCWPSVILCSDPGCCSSQPPCSSQGCWP